MTEVNTAVITILILVKVNTNTYHKESMLSKNSLYSSDSLAVTVIVNIHVIRTIDVRRYLSSMNILFQ